MKPTIGGLSAEQEAEWQRIYEAGGIPALVENGQIIDRSKSYHRDEDAQFQHAVTEAFERDAQPISADAARPFSGQRLHDPNVEFEKAQDSVKPFAPDGSPIDPLLQWFDQPKVPNESQATAIHAARAHYRIVSLWIVKTIPRGPERTVALRKLLESKEAVTRAVLAE